MEPQPNDEGGGDVAGLSIVMPAYNEARRLPGTLPRVVAYASRLDEPVEILVVDDGSSDGTAEVTASIAAKSDLVTLLRSDRNRGKGAAVGRGLIAGGGGGVLLSGGGSW
jgi:glycosyltransferase involved in cell wall biosynthesis